MSWWSPWRLFDCLVGIAVALALDQADAVVRRAAGRRRLGMPVLGTIPRT